MTLLVWAKKDAYFCASSKKTHFRMGKETFENTEGAIRNGHSRETGNIGNTRRRKTKQKHNAICVGHNFTEIKHK
jgi:hypothetical protein